MKRVVAWVLRIVQILIAVFVVAEGFILISVAPGTIEGFDWFVNSDTSLDTLGSFFVFSGSLLFWGKLFRQDRVIGHGLLLVYLCFLFGGILNWLALSWHEGLPNIVMSAIVGLLYLRWKYHIYYVEPKKEWLNQDESLRERASRISRH